MHKTVIKKLKSKLWKLKMVYLPATNFCSDEQLVNLTKLLNFLKIEVALLPEFNMVSYYNYKEEFKIKTIPSDVKNKCGTVCCLAGHGPLAGVTSLPKETWNDYVDRVFTKSEQAYCFLFDSEWVNYQPTKEQAIFRLELFFKKGLPLSFSYPIMNYSLGTTHNFQKEPMIGKHTFSDFKDQCLLGCHTLD